MAEKVKNIKEYILKRDNSGNSLALIEDIKEIAFDRFRRYSDETFNSQLKRRKREIEKEYYLYSFNFKSVFDDGLTGENQEKLLRDLFNEIGEAIITDKKHHI